MKNKIEEHICKCLRCGRKFYRGGLNATCQECLEDIKKKNKDYMLKVLNRQRITDRFEILDL
jgi:hypothetical protein